MNRHPTRTGTARGGDMLRSRRLLGCVVLAAATLLLVAGVRTAVAAEPDLTWSPKPSGFESGSSVRYIDFGNGSDANPGTKERPWKHLHGRHALG